MKVFYAVLLEKPVEFCSAPGIYTTFIKAQIDSRHVIKGEVTIVLKEKTREQHHYLPGDKVFVRGDIKVDHGIKLYAEMIKKRGHTEPRNYHFPHEYEH